MHGEVRSGWDFSLVKIAISMGCYGLVMVSFRTPAPLLLAPNPSLTAPLHVQQAIMQLKMLYMA